jgi:hypothetical protein
MNDGSSYRGPERRIHQMYVTRNTEYHFRGGICVAVRDKRTGQWVQEHQALGRNISGAIRFNDVGDAYPALTQPSVGDAIFFAVGGPDVVTSCLTAIERPERSVVVEYPN